MSEINFFWDPLSDNILQERDETGAVTAEYTAEPGLYGNIISQNRGGVESQFHYDAQGSTLAVTDDSQNVTDTRAYSAFGETTESTGSTSFPFQYIGQKGYYRDTLTGDYLARHRPLDSRRGRWQTGDPLGLDRANVNLYGYCANNPVRYQDPSGLMVSTKCPIGKVDEGVIATLVCVGKQLTLAWVDKKDPRTGKDYDQCVLACMEVHENVHIKQFTEFCPKWCDCDEHANQSPGYPIDKSANDIECPAYLAEVECLRDYITSGRKVNCDRFAILARIEELDLLANPLSRGPFSCLWPLALTDEQLNPPKAVPGAERPPMGDGAGTRGAKLPGVPEPTGFVPSWRNKLASTPKDKDVIF